MPEQILKYDIKKYNFIELITNLFNSPLNELHQIAKKEYELFTEIGKDSNTEFHKLFYKKLNQGWDEIYQVYQKFVADIILPYLNLDEALYQAFPTFRVQLPNNVAVVKPHYDSDDDHKHPIGEINFIVALTSMNDSNTVWIESEPRLKDFHPMNLKIGEFVKFIGNRCTHFNHINKMEKTRVSFDFRIMPLDKYNPNYTAESCIKKTRYIEGGYYRRIKSSIKAKDHWDKAKHLFNSTLIKYGLNDPWDIVDLFEKKVAKYAGSKYAVAVDNCTNAIFLCLKYLKNEGNTITIPARTYVSVPCTIINAGCKVKFEDIEWTGAYQLKPTNIYDSAVRFKKNMYIPGTYYCLSFHIRKHLPIGKGGMILTDDPDAVEWFKIARYEGRHYSVPYKDDKFTMIGWNMYMSPEQAAKGLELFEKKPDFNSDQESSGSSLDLTQFSSLYEN